MVGGKMELSHLAGCVATEEEAVCLSHDGDSRCLNCILGKEEGESSENDSSHKPEEQKGHTKAHILGMAPRCYPLLRHSNPDAAWVSPAPGLYLLCLLDSVKVNLQYVVLQPTNKQCAAVSQQKTVHILTLIQPVGGEERLRGQGL